MCQRQLIKQNLVFYWFLPNAGQEDSSAHICDSLSTLQERGGTSSRNLQYNTGEQNYRKQGVGANLVSRKIGKYQDLESDDVIVDVGDKNQDEILQEENGGNQGSVNPRNEQQAQNLWQQSFNNEDKYENFNLKNTDENMDDVFDEQKYNEGNILVYEENQGYIEDDLSNIYEQEYGIQFQNQEQRTYRISIYQRNEQEIQEYNQDPTATYKRGNTGLMYYDPQQFINLVMMKLPERPPQSATFLKAPEEWQIQYVDWREHMTQVRNQKTKCNACYAFTVTSLIQAYYSMKARESIKFSEQQLVDCCKGACYGCWGGYPDGAIFYLSQEGLETLENYPYKADVQKCQIKRTSKTIKLIDQDEPYKAVYGVENLRFALKTGPVAVLVDIRSWDPLYKSGLIKICQDQNFVFNHAAVLSGIREEDDAWLVRNSWGASWGYDGYGFLPTGNTCGIAENGAVPNVLSDYSSQIQQQISQDQQQTYKQDQFEEQTTQTQQNFIQDDIYNQQQNQQQNQQYTESYTSQQFEPEEWYQQIPGSENQQNEQTQTQQEQQFINYYDQQLQGGFEQVMKMNQNYMDKQNNFDSNNNNVNVDVRDNNNGNFDNNSDTKNNNDIQILNRLPKVTYQIKPKQNSNFSSPFNPSNSNTKNTSKIIQNSQQNTPNTNTNNNNTNKIINSGIIIPNFNNNNNNNNPKNNTSSGSNINLSSFNPEDQNTVMGWIRRNRQ